MIRDTANRIRTQIPTLKKVAGAVSLDRAMTGLTIEPAAFVLALAESSSPNEDEGATMNAVSQHVTALVGVVLCVKSLIDTQGEEALEVLQPFKDALDNALLLWSPDANVFAPFDYSGGQLLGFKDQVLFWQADYVTSFYKRR